MGNIVDTSFKEIWRSERYWEIMDFIVSNKFDAKRMCGSLCLQHKVNEFLWDLKNGDITTKKPKDNTPMYINFV